MTEKNTVYRCERIRDETPDVRTFVLAPVSGQRLDFRPGQFVNLEVPAAEPAIWRSFTIASSPAALGGALEITIKRQAPAGATEWLFDNLMPGRAVQIEGPFGRFHAGTEPHPLLLVSAGSGATPMMSILRWLEDAGDRRPVCYVHCARTEADLLFRAEVERLAAKRPGMAVEWIVTSREGRPDKARWARLADRLAHYDVFCCGPAGFMATLKEAQRAAGGSEARWHEESFEAAPIEAAATEDDAGAGHPIRFEPAGVEIACRAGETILQAGLRAGLPLKSSCRKGMCSTCRLSKLSGEVDMQQDGGLFDDEVEAGDILACCSRPLGPVTLKFP